MPAGPVSLFPNIFTAIHAEIMSDIFCKVNIITANYAALMIVIRRIYLLEMLQLNKPSTLEEVENQRLSLELLEIFLSARRLG